MLAIPSTNSIDLGTHGQLVFDTNLTQAQVSKFKGLIEGLIVVDNSPYLRLDELHGVLLTNGKQQARNIVNANHDLVKNYLVYDPIKFKPFKVTSAIKPIGLYILLDHLTVVKPSRAPEYRASLVLLSYIMAKHPGVMLGDWKNAQAQFQSVSRAMRQIKQLHSVCQLTDHPFYSGDEKHVHHIEGQSENPSLASDTSNLVVIHGWVHDDYHSWVIKKGMPVCRASFWFYANKRGYRSQFVKDLNANNLATV